MMAFTTLSPRALERAVVHVGLLGMLLIGACGGTKEPLPLALNDGCPFGAEPGFLPVPQTLVVGDSLLLTSGSRPAFSICFPGVSFAVTWEARPDSALRLAAVSDSTAWAHSRSPGEVLVTARLINRPDLFGVMTLTVQ